MKIKYIKLLIAIVLICLVKPSNTQNIFDYEQRIELSADYKKQEIEFKNSAADVQLSGTLIYPKGGYEKIVMIVPGSGKDTRHSHFIIAEHFLKHNIAVYRFDDRGVGKSGGKFIDTASGLIEDVTYAYHELKNKEELSNKKIGVLGHSLGGIASIGAYGKGGDFDFLIQMSTPVENNGAFLKHQASVMTDGWSSVKHKSPKEVVKFVEALAEIVLVEDDFKTTKEKAKLLVKQMDFKKGRHIVNPIIIDLLKQQHEKTYQTSTAPILYIIGTEDKHVSSKHEIIALERLSNPNIETKVIENVGHYLTDKLAPSIYSMQETAISKIVNWTLER